MNGNGSNGNEGVPAMVRVIDLDVYANTRYKAAGTANGGISERYDSVCVACPDGCHEVAGDVEPENMVRIRAVRRAWGWNVWLEPVAPVPDGCTGYMAGGSYAASSDSRYRECIARALAGAGASEQDARASSWLVGALPLHDRVETFAQAEALGR